MAGRLFKVTIVSLALTSSAMAATSLRSNARTVASALSNATLAPVTIASDDVLIFNPSFDVCLRYGPQQNNESSVDVNLTTSSPSVLLETLRTVTSVVCATDSISVVFDNADDLASAYSQWSNHSMLVFVTNHMGDCDTEFERGFFTANNYTSDNSTLTLVASTQKASINDIASEIRTTFSGMSIQPSSISKAKRGLGTVTYSPDPINFNTEVVLNKTLLFSDENFNATLDSGDFSLSVTIGGSLTYNILSSTLVELVLYLETNTSSSLVLDFGISVPVDKLFSYTEALDLYAIEIPGLLSFGPKITFTIGAEVIVDAAVDVALNLSSNIYNGSFTLDYAGNVSASGSWSPTFNASVEVSEASGVSINPFVASLFELELSILGGLFNVSSGITPNVSFPTTVLLDANQETGTVNNETVTLTDKVSGACDNGVELVSDYAFSLDAFVTGQWNHDRVYNVSLPILDQCLSWA